MSKRDLRADLEYCQNRIKEGRLYNTQVWDFVGMAIHAWPKAIERAIEAEAELNQIKNHPENRGLISLLEDTLKQKVQILDMMAALTEENDIQRQAIQNLSAQVAEYQEIAKSLDCRIRNFCKMDKLFKIATVAAYHVDSACIDCAYIDHPAAECVKRCEHGPLRQALADLEGGDAMPG